MHQQPKYKKNNIESNEWRKTKTNLGCWDSILCYEYQQKNWITSIQHFFAFIQFHLTIDESLCNLFTAFVWFICLSHSFVRSVQLFVRYLVCFEDTVSAQTNFRFLSIFFCCWIFVISFTCSINRWPLFVRKSCCVQIFSHEFS